MERFVVQLALAGGDNGPGGVEGHRREKYGGAEENGLRMVIRNSRERGLKKKKACGCSSRSSLELSVRAPGDSEDRCLLG